MPDAKHPLPTLRTTQFNLRTLFMLFFCLSVGLTIGIGPSTEFDGWIDLLSGVPGIAYEVLLATGSAAIVIGLLQQVVRISQSCSAKLIIESSQRRTLRLAIFWRIAVAVLLALCLLLEMLLVHDFFTLPESDEFRPVFDGPVVPLYIRYACILVVLVDYRTRLLPVANAVLPSWRSRVAFVATCLLVVIILPRNLMIHFLVYIAMAGVEVAQLSRFQRPGAYPNHEADGFFFFWIACAAMACFFLGAAIYYWLLISPKKRFILRLILGATAVALLGCSSWYGIWYHAVGLPRIAPDFAEAGFQSDWFDWVEAAALLTILVTAASFRIAGDQTRTVGLEDRTGIEKPVFYESFSIVLIFAGIAALFPLEFLISVFSDWSGVGVSFSELFYYVATTIEYYFPIAIYLLILQIIWLRWRHGPAQKAYYLPVISGRKMAIAWLSLMLFAIIGIPTISAFCFSFWLGPWYLL